MKKYNYQQIISQRAVKQPNNLAYVFLNKRGEEEDQVTFKELDERIRIVAAKLQLYSKAQDRILIVLENSIDYLIAFYACIYTNMVAVTMHTPRNTIQLVRMKNISDDCNAVCLLTNSQALKKHNSNISSLVESQQLNLILVDQIDGRKEKYQTPEIKHSDLALLQYTSGSTSTPKGVMVAHSHLMVQGECLKEGFDLSNQDVSVTWLPLSRL
ncbi:AMP-binding protein [Candidatus Uabimicrobium sp. HlEnr_7]|uniref:AMP-binding protein n=1 Tax=Candidatus Uabimicrobium helgolandensis TaxID=3095367 RepID=UPI0035581D82